MHITSHRPLSASFSMINKASSGLPVCSDQRLLCMHGVRRMKLELLTVREELTDGIADTMGNRKRLDRVHRPVGRGAPAD